MIKQTKTPVEPRYFNELVRILKAAYTKDTISVAREARNIAGKYRNKSFEERATKIEQLAYRLERNNSKGDLMDLDDLARKNGMDFFNPEDSMRYAKGYVMSKTNKRIINELILVMERKEAFWEAEIDLPNKTLMFGPPGTGKTTCAHYIASILKLPLLIVRLDSLVDSSMGGTAKNIRKVFDLANKQPCILFLDEFDAVAVSRAQQGSNEVGREMSRVVNSLLQNIDALDDEVILFAATNLSTEIDAAVWRRFQNRMEFEKPGTEEMFVYLEGSLKDRLLVEQITGLFEDKTFAEVSIVINRAKVKSIIYGEELSYELFEQAADEQLEQKN